MNKAEQLENLIALQKKHEELSLMYDHLQYAVNILTDVKIRDLGSFKLYFGGHNEYQLSTEFTQDEFSKEFIDDLKTIVKGERMRVERKILDIGWEKEDE